MSKTETTLTPHDWEWEQLWSWHRERMFEHADKLDYASAESNKRRAEEIREMLDAKA